MQALLSIMIFISLIPWARPGNETDHQALLAIKSKISQDPNKIMSSWNESIPLCKWRGITCGRRHKRVVSLDLSSSKLVGTLSPYVGNLSFLRVLLLINNTFQGTIPSQIGRLSRLRWMSLYNNSFDGEIPSNLSRCVDLVNLFLDRNMLIGRIPIELSSLPNLKGFGLSENNLSGRLHETKITNMTSLEVLDLLENNIEGNIPNDIGQLTRLFQLQLGYNRLSGTIPTSLFNLSSLEYLQLDYCELYGQLPQDLGLLLPNLKSLHIYNNYLSGFVPKSLSNLSQLENIDLSNNNFTGKFLFHGKNMKKLERFVLLSAFTGRDEANDLSFLETLTNCSSLTALEVGMNDFGGFLPNAIVNLSTSLEYIHLGGNRISGSLPIGMGKFVNLKTFLVSLNQFTGSIPTDIGGMEKLEGLYFDSNFFSGNIPSSFGNLSRMGNLILNNNNLVGNIPPSLGNCKYLLRLYLFRNNLSGMLPFELFYASELVQLGIDGNNLQGKLPVEHGNLKNLVDLSISNNMFSGEIPSTLGSCTNLLHIYMEDNSFSGLIPMSLSSLKGILYINFSHNNLSGEVPSYLSYLPLVNLDLSFNNFEGEVPVKGVFTNATIVSLEGNKRLCGGVLKLNFPRCPSLRRKVSFKKLKIIIFVVATIVLIVVIVIALLFYFLYSRRKTESTSFETQDIRAFLEVSYRTLWEATEGFSRSNMIGVGGFGSVFKGIIRQDDVEMRVAIKVMNLQNDRANASLIAECNALRNIRHRNLVKIITACSSIDYQNNDFEALVYEFMPKGSLENWLHPIAFVDQQGDDAQLCCLSVLQRLNIIIDVACAIDYLHNECPTPIIHCDLKPSNILLDDEMTAHVSDFGLSKFHMGASSSGNQTNSSQVRGTIGYTAPEYGLGSKVSTQGDIYSFGIIVLETITTKKPIDPTFTEGLNLHDLAKSTLPSHVMKIVDPKLMDEGNLWLARNNGDIRKFECIKLLINIGIHCSLELPQERMHIKDVVNQLKSAKQNLFDRRN